MKKHFLFALMLSVLNIVGFAQSYNTQSALEDFFENSNAMKGLAQCAHPTNTYNRGTYYVDGNRVRVTAYYDDGSYTVITATYESNGDYFSTVGYTKDTDGFPPFIGIQFIKDILIECFKKSGDASCLERFFRQTTNDMTGTQLTRAFLTDSWWQWNGKKCNSY